MSKSMFGPLTGSKVARRCGRCGEGFHMAETDWWLHPTRRWCCAGCGEKDPWRQKQIARVRDGLAAGKSIEAIRRETGLGEKVMRGLVNIVRAEVAV